MLHAMMITFGVLLAIVLFQCIPLFFVLAAKLLRMLFVDYYWIWWIAAFAWIGLGVWLADNSNDEGIKIALGLGFFLFLGIGWLGEKIHKRNIRKNSEYWEAVAAKNRKIEEDKFKKFEARVLEESGGLSATAFLGEISCGMLKRTPERDELYLHYVGEYPF